MHGRAPTQPDAFSMPPVNILANTPANAQGDAAWVAWLSLGQLVGWGSVFYAFSMLMDPVEQALGLGRSEVSLAFSLALLAEGVAAFAVGRWIDRGHARRVMAGGSALAGACLLALSQVQGVWGWTLVWMGLGVAMAATLYTPAFAVLTQRHPLHFRRQIITVTFLGGLASTVFIPLMAWLLHAVGWRHMLWVLAACQWLVCLPIHAWLLHPKRNPPPTTSPRHTGAAPGAAPDTPLAQQVALAHAGGLPTEPASYRQALREPAFVLVGVFVVLMMGVTVAIATHLVSLLTESGLPAAWAVALPASIGLVQVVGRSLLYFFEHRASVHTVNRWIPGLIPLGLLALLGALAAVHRWPQAAGLAMAATVAFVALYGLGNGMLTIVKGTAVAQYVSRTHAASLNGALGIPQALGRAAAPWLLGVMWSPEAGYLHGLWLLLAASLVAMAALVAAQRLAPAAA